MNAVEHAPISGSATATPATRPSRRRRPAQPQVPAISAVELARMRGPAEREWDEVVSAILCRGLNVAVALLALVVTSPLMAIIALLIRITSPGPVFYRQPRVGRNRRAFGPRSTDRDLGGQPFMIWKFRTMRADTGGAQVWASRGDPRITTLGRLLRGFRLDELPQFINVLTGDMNIVGPRPEQPKIATELRTQVDGYEERLAVPPGITGLAQVTLGYDTDLDGVRKKVALDLLYVHARSPWLDLMIMLQTPMVMLLRRGAQ
jgi:lipopolysaccharide/colanic/teichoic acid biosynthesis glycosyltransferase